MWATQFKYDKQCLTSFTFYSMNTKLNRLPGLNGMRAIAAIAVVMAHIGIALQKFNLPPILYSDPDKTKNAWNLFGSNCVSIFFVISGFLITWLFLMEQELFNKVDIKKFYLRRMLRIWPLYYGYLIISVAVSIKFNLGIYFKSLLLYVLFAPNIPFIIGPRIQLLTHYWSLGVEEQFYIFWPLVSTKARTILQLAIALIVILISCRLTLHSLYPQSIFEKFLSVTRVHCMMIGAVGAVFYKQEHTLFLKLINNKITQTISWALLLPMVFYQYPPVRFFIPEIVSVLSLCIIIGQIKVYHRIINLENKLLNFLGNISYGIYVFHPLVIFLFSKLLSPLALPDLIKCLLIYTSVFATTILLAYLSYSYFEKYFLTIKKKFEVVKAL